MSKRQRKGRKSKKSWLSKRCYFCLLLAITMLLVSGSTAVAGDADTKDFSSLNTIWMLIAGALVFFMNAGFAMIEAGFCRRGNATNVLAKNLIVFCISALAFWLFGFGLMFSDSNSGLTGQYGFAFELKFPNELNPNPFPTPGFKALKQTWENRSFAALFFFQLAFAGTSATIVSGSVAERIKFWAFVIFSFFLVGFSYPFTGHWVWGSNGWLKTSINFQDFAGSTVVHSVGGMAALVGAWLLKPRQGRFGYNLNCQRFEGNEIENFSSHNLGFATLGCLILWLGWFGFNGGSTSEMQYVPHIIMTTMMAGAAGGIAVILFSAIITGKPSLASMINGILGGLVAITASSAYVNVKSALIIGAFSAIVVLLGDFFLEVLKIDDPVGAVPVHLFCGFWGTLAVGIFGDKNSLLYNTSNSYNPFTQTFNQFLGWMIVITITGLFSVIAWIFSGILLHYWNLLNDFLSSHRITTSKHNQISHQPFNLGRFLIKHIEIGRNGIRVSESEERRGSDGVFYDP